MTDIPAPVLARFESDLATRLGLMRKKTRHNGSQLANIRSGKHGRGRMNSPLASLPNLNIANSTEINAEKDCTLPAIANQPKHSSQLDLAREVHSNMNSRYGGSYNRNQHYSVNATGGRQKKVTSALEIREGPAQVYSNSLTAKGGAAPNLRY